jgi:hypothetical protein
MDVGGGKLLFTGLQSKHSQCYFGRDFVTHSMIPRIVAHDVALCVLLGVKDVHLCSTHWPAGCTVTAHCQLHGFVPEWDCVCRQSAMPIANCSQGHVLVAALAGFSSALVH